MLFFYFGARFSRGQGRFRQCDVCFPPGQDCFRQRWLGLRLRSRRCSNSYAVTAIYPLFP